MEEHHPMNRILHLLGISAAMCLVAAAPPSLAGDLYVNPDGVCGGNLPCFTNLQDAINAASPGDVIHVQAAVYPVSARIDVTQSVTIRGAQAGVNPLPSQGTTRVPGSGAEAILDGGGSVSTILRVLADDVVVNGLEVRNGTGDLIDSRTETPTVGTVLKNNIIHHSSGDEGVQLRAVQDAYVECNLVYETAGDGLNVCCGSTGGVIRWNEVRDIHSDNGAIYVYDAAGTSILGNLVYGTTQNDGIKLGSKDGSDATLFGGTILGNVVHDTRQDGISVYMSGVDVDCNEVYASASENGGIYVAHAVSSVTVENNHVHDNAFDTIKWGNPAGIMIGTGPDVGTLVVTNNHLHNNSPNGVTNKAVGTLNAVGNYWGSPDGPGPVGPGSGDAVSTDVDYSGWLTGAPVYTCPAVGTCGDGPVATEPGSWGAIKSRFR
jgi:hypothetical protein